MRTRGGGVQNPEIFADVIYGWSQTTVIMRNEHLHKRGNLYDATTFKHHVDGNEDCALKVVASYKVLTFNIMLKVRLG